MDNIKSIINKHNKKVTNAENDTNTDTQVDAIAVTKTNARLTTNAWPSV